MGLPASLIVNIVIVRIIISDLSFLFSLVFDPLQSRGNYIATSNNIMLVH